MTLITYEEIVKHKQTPILVLAGPGSGKTYMLADRIKRLLNEGVSKETLTVITFGRDASKNMVDTLVDPNEAFQLKYNELPLICTMHSLGFKIIQEKPRDVNLLKTNLKVQNNDYVKKLMFRDAAYIIGLDNSVSEEAIECKQYGDCNIDPEENRCKVCKKYRELMSKCNYVDFDDQILFACDILETNPDILEKYQQQAFHLLVDEYQDINAAQFRLIEILSRENRNGLFVVGDDAQSIYRFRGGDPKFILNFEDDFENAQMTTLAVSRRCHEKIMDDAFTVLETYYTDWSGRPELEYLALEDDAPHIIQAASEKAETKIIANITFEALQNKESVLILVPKKDFFPLIIKTFEKYGIPYDCPFSFMPRSLEILNLILDWLSNNDDNFLSRLIIEELINAGDNKVAGRTKNPRTCNQTTIDNRIDEEQKIAALWESVDRTNSLYSLIQSEDENSTLKGIKEGLDILMELKDSNTASKRGDFIKQLACISEVWSKGENFEKDIRKLADLLKINESKVSNTAKIMTMKKAKGLTFDIVLIVGIEDDIIPNPYGDEIEEARLFYVSMTRAKKKLYLIHSSRRPRNISFGQDIIGKARSRFLDTLGRVSQFRRY